MRDEEKIETEDLGVLPNGCNLFRQKNSAGGYTYSSDEIAGSVRVWDTCLVNEGTLLAAMACEHHRKYLEHMHKQGWRPNKTMQNERMAATGGGFLADGAYYVNDPIRHGAAGESNDNETKKE